MKGKKTKKDVGDSAVNVSSETSTEDSAETAIEETVEVTADEEQGDSVESAEEVTDSGAEPVSEEASSPEATGGEAADPAPAEAAAAEEPSDAPAEDESVATEEPSGAPAEDEPVVTEEASGAAAEDEPLATEEASGPPAADVAGEGTEQEPAQTEGEAEAEAQPVDPESERRQAGRKGVKLNRLIASRVVDGSSHRECYLHLVDISEGGVRVNSDDPFPSDREFTLEIGLAAFGTEIATRKPRIAFPVRVVWTKSLVGGMVVSGLAFVNLDEESQSIVAAIMQGASPQGRRQHFRLNRVLGVELGGAGNERWLYPLTLDLSVEGMRICLSETLEVGAKFPIRIFLEFELPTVEAASEVMWQEVMPSGRVQVGLKFDDMSERDAMAIKTYIDQCLEQDQSHRNL